MEVARRERAHAFGLGAARTESRASPVTRVFALAMALTFCTSTGRAAAGETPRRAHAEQTAEFWRDVRQPGFRRSLAMAYQRFAELLKTYTVTIAPLSAGTATQ